MMNADGRPTGTCYLVIALFLLIGCEGERQDEIDRDGIVRLGAVWYHGDLGDLGVGELRRNTTNERVDEIRSAIRKYVSNKLPNIELTPADKIEVANLSKGRNGVTHIRIRQTHLGLSVDGADAWFHVRHNGRIETINGYLTGNIQQEIVPMLTAQDAIESTGSSLRAFGRVRTRVLEPPSLVYRAAPQTETRLAWKVILDWSDEIDLYQDKFYVDAENGKILARVGLLHKGLFRRIYDAQDESWMPGALLFAEGGSSSDPLAMAAYNNLGTVYHFMKSEFDRESYNGRAAPLNATVHFLFERGNRPATRNSASWSDYHRSLVFGDGDGRNFRPFAYALDVTAHEIFHGVTSSTANLEYHGESGALNEAISDIFGASCEAWSADGIGSKTWKIGEDVYTPRLSGDAMRYMNDPTLDGTSRDFYPERYVGADNYGGVHLNSGIANLSFYLLVEGGSHPGGKSNISVTGIGLKRAKAIYYGALTRYLTCSSDFKMARNATVQVAQDLYGEETAAAVEASWEAVGVPLSVTQNDVEMKNGDSVNDLGASREQEVHFYIEVPTDAANLVLQSSGGRGNADLYVRYSERPTVSIYDHDSRSLDSNEMVVIEAPAVGTWYGMLRGSSEFSGVTLSGGYQVGTTKRVPVADFTVSISNLEVLFTDASSDADGTVVARSWSFGDDETSCEVNPGHTYHSPGSYSVTLTVTDNDGASHSTTRVIVLTDTISGPTELQNGSSVGDLTASAGQELLFMLAVPNGATKLKVSIYGGVGDADMYVRRGALPTTSAFDYRPYRSGNNETIRVSTPEGGSWYVMIRACKAFSGLFLNGSFE